MDGKENNMTKTTTTFPFICTYGCDNRQYAECRPLDVTTELCVGGLYVRADGYSDCCSQDGYGQQVVIENRHGVPHVIIWADINDEDPTHIVSLAGAAESERRK